MTTYGRPRLPGTVSTQEAALILGVSADTVQLLWTDGRLPEAEGPSGRRPRFFWREDVERYAALRAVRALPRRWRGLDLASADERLRARFWSKVNADGPVPAHRPELGQCWVWTRHCAEFGYGQFVLRRGEFRLAHVVSYALTKGTVPPRIQVCHHCDNPPCVRPEHLFLGTAADNANDCIAKGRGNRARGVDTHSARLNDEAVRIIRATPSYYGRTRDLARRFGVSDHAINDVLRRRTWRHVA